MADVAKVHRWLPWLAPRLPVPVPTVLGLGRGRALSMALIQLPYYLRTNPLIAAHARHVIHAVLADHRDRRAA